MWRARFTPLPRTDLAVYQISAFEYIRLVGVIWLKYPSGVMLQISTTLVYSAALPCTICFFQCYSVVGMLNRSKILFYGLHESQFQDGHLWGYLSFGFVLEAAVSFCNICLLTDRQVNAKQVNRWATTAGRQALPALQQPQSHPPNIIQLTLGIQLNCIFFFSRGMELLDNHCHQLQRRAAPNHMNCIYS